MKGATVDASSPLPFKEPRGYTRHHEDVRLRQVLGRATDVQGSCRSAGRASASREFSRWGVRGVGRAARDTGQSE